MKSASEQKRDETKCIKYATSNELPTMLNDSESSIYTTEICIVQAKNLLNNASLIESEVQPFRDNYNVFIKFLGFRMPASTNGYGTQSIPPCNFPA